MHATPEFFKLDSTDRKVLFWMMDHNSQSLRAWIEYMAGQYASNRNIRIDPDRLFNEVIIELPSDENARSDKAWRPKNILLVDDETIFNFLHTRILQLTKVTSNIQAALNGSQAIELLKTNLADRQPDVIILDLAMPVMDGFTFLEAFQKLELPGKDKINIIVLTSSIDQRDRLKAKAMGITHYLVKPVDERELCVAVIST